MDLNHLTELDQSFGSLSDDDAVALFLAWRSGLKIEMKQAEGGWKVNSVPSWFKSSYYRLALVETKLDWSHVDPTYKFCATDEEGDVYLYENEPIVGYSSWTASGDVIRAECLASLKPGTANWRKSLIRRPPPRSETDKD